jgi:hypothetical protein
MNRETVWILIRFNNRREEYLGSYESKEAVMQAVKDDSNLVVDFWNTWDDDETKLLGYNSLSDFPCMQAFEDEIRVKK